MQVAQLRELLQRVLPAEEKRRATELDGCIQRARVEVVVPQQDEREVVGVGDGVAERRRHAERVGPLAELGLAHALKRRLVGGELLRARDDAVACREDAKVERRALSVGRVRGPERGHAPHQPDVLLARVQLLGRAQ